MQSYLIMMAVRLLEMKRLLKPTGSIYLHCDPTASHYLKMAMDTIFGASNYRSEIVWKRQSAHSSARRYGPVHDIVLFYSQSNNYIWNRGYQAYESAHVKSAYRREDPDGRKFSVGDLTGPGMRQGESGTPWRGINPTGRGRHWAPPRRFPGGENVPKGVLEALDYLDRIGRIYWSKEEKPGFKRYMDEMSGIAVQDVITDIAPTAGKERTSYPTQKPLALLERIIKASSSEGDVVLDPFCGCATALVAAENLERQWVGIDLSAKAKDLILTRMRKELGLFSFKAIFRDDLPSRTDMGKLPAYQTHKNTLYGQQEGLCAGCQTLFPIRNFTIDHIVARSRGGSDHLANLQLLCGACNSTKGAKTQEEFLATLKREGIR